MLTIHVWPKRLKEFLLTHPLYKSPCKYENRAAGKGGGGQIRHMLEKNWKEA